MEKFILKLIRTYQKTFSPDHGTIFTGGFARCRFYPSCSQYSYEAVEKYGLKKGFWKGFFRILKCNPFSSGGIDLLK